MGEAIRTSAVRVGNFTSSEIWKLMTEPTAAAIKKGETFGAPAKTYIAEKNMERRLGRPLSEDVTARPLAWGELNEKRVFNLLGIEYKECSQETIVHPGFDFWSGSPDGQKFDDEGNTLAETKCPQTLKSFCTLVDCIKEGLTGQEIMNLIRENHTDGDKFFWQCISNAILTGSKFAELIIYVPYKSELEAIKELARNYDGVDQWKYKWIDTPNDEELPYLLDGGYYKALIIIRWEVKQEDKDALTSMVIEAGKLLIK